MPYTDLTADVDIRRRFRGQLEARGLHAALGVLNAAVDFRFTGVYRFEGDLVVSVALFDRENSELRIGEDVRLLESYCRMTAVDGDRCAIEDSNADHRLAEHAARMAVHSYGAVLLRNPDGTPLGTLCHFDIRPRPLDDSIFALLEAVRPDIEDAVLARRGIPERAPGEHPIANFASALPPAGE